jgi:anti-anti-sigma factor
MGAMHLTISATQDDGVVVVRPLGEVDRDTAGILASALTDAVAEAGAAGAVEVDLDGISFLDSSGIGALLTGQRAATAAGTGFRIRDPQPRIREVLEITQVWRLLGGTD